MSLHRSCFQVDHSTNGYLNGGVSKNCANHSCNARGKYTKPCIQQPKIMSPALNDSSPRRNFVSSLSIISKGKVPKIVVLPSIDTDIAASSVKSASHKIPVVITGDKSSRRAAKRLEGKKPQTKYISCLHTSLSTEWKKDSLEKETSYEEHEKTDSFQEGNHKLRMNTAYRISSTTGKTALLSCSGEKVDNSRDFRRREEEKRISPIHQIIKKPTNMDKQTVRIQYPPRTGKSFTIKDTAVTDTKRADPNARNTVSSVSERNVRRGFRAGMLPKTRFRVKIQKCHHKSVNIPDSFYCNGDKEGKTVARSSKSVFVQNKSAQRSFSVQS